MNTLIPTDNELAQAWTKRALDHAHAQDKIKVAGYLATVLEDLLFEKGIPQHQPVDEDSHSPASS